MASRCFCYCVGHFHSSMHDGFGEPNGSVAARGSERISCAVIVDNSSTFGERVFLLCTAYCQNCASTASETCNERLTHSVVIGFFRRVCIVLARFACAMLFSSSQLFLDSRHGLFISPCHVRKYQVCVIRITSI